MTHAPTPSEIVAMLKKRPRACEAIGCENRWARELGDGVGFITLAPINVSCYLSDEVGGGWHIATHDLALGRCLRLCHADGMEPIRNVVGFWRVYDMETGQPVTDPFESPLEAMLEYLEKREEPK